MKPISHFHIGALGDSITTAFNAHAPRDNPTLSWATGDASESHVVSHARRLAQVFPALTISTHNHAATGARAAAIPAQATALAASAPDYATLLVGANDLTDWLFLGEYEARLDAFVANIRTAVRTLITANPRVMILLVAVPDQGRVVDLMMKDRGRALVHAAPWLESGVLEMVRKTYRERHERINHALAAVASAFPANVRLAAGVGHVRFEAEHLSPHDFYHPSRKGQAMLADQAWAEGWF